MSTSCRALSILNKLLTKNKVVQGKHLHVYRKLAAKVAFNLSDIGEGIREVAVKEWYVKAGDKVSQFDNICEVQSDKASVTITSRYDGVVSKLHYKVDDIALVGKPLIDIETDSDIVEGANDVTETVDKPIMEETKTRQDEHVEESHNEAFCIPSVRRLAKEHKLDLANIKGTGKQGRILKEDVLKHIQGPKPTKVPVTDEARIEPIKGFKKAMVKTMTEAMKIPHFVYSDEIKVTELSKVRSNLRESHDTKLSLVPFFVKAVSNALQRYPIINASVDEHCENIIYHKSHNIGIAMDTALGLAVPVIKNVENLSIMEISSELQRLIENGKDGNFSPSDLSGGTFTVSNVGSIGGTYTKPLILTPQVAIIAVGATKIVPGFDSSKNIIAEEIINISGSADHRIIDGATMARFVKVLKKQLENPYLLFLNM
nr:lipoamide acyltransferase component of branched-chain alpha-keto acid dehydrogenase complex, mitochondrial [Leptinotarsa decemlineata]